jgi:O-antigen/teichoic acid export membrane protein
MMARITGSDLIINSFFGTAVNGAFAVSKTVNNYIMSFSSNFDTASGPQIIQTFGTGDNDRCNYLVNKLGRFSLLLFILIFFPLYIELDFILHLWLKKVPDGVLLFCQLNLLLAAVSLTCGGIMQVISASGKIKWFKIVGGIIAFVCVLSGYLLIQNGAPAYTMIVVFIVADVVNRIIQLALMKFIIGFNSWRYVREAYLRPFVIALIMSICLYIYSLLALDNMVLKLLAIMGCLGITSTLVFTIGMTSGEKNKLLAFVKNKIR